MRRLLNWTKSGGVPPAPETNPPKKIIGGEICEALLEVANFQWS